MEEISFWSSKETNNYLYKQLKTLSETYGFVVSTIKAKHLVRIREHHIQIISPEIVYGRTGLEMFVVPSASYSNYIYASKQIVLRGKSNPRPWEVCYTDMAIVDENTGKHQYRPEEIQQAWEKVISLQIETEIISYFDSFGFPEFIHLSQNQLNGTLYCRGCPANDDALHFLTLGYNAAWQGNFDSALPLLKKAIAGYEKYDERSTEFGYEKDLRMFQNQAAAEEMVYIIEAKYDNKEIINKLCFLEEDAMEKAWGIVLDKHGNTVRIKKRNK